MKIGIDASRFGYAQATGVEWYSWHIINGLINSEFSAEDKKNHFILYSREKLALKNLPSNFENKIISRKRFWTLVGLTKEMRESPPDLLFVSSHTMPLKLPDKTVITIHDLAFKHLKKAYSLSQYHYLNWSTKMAVKKANKIIVPSEATKKDLIKFYKCQPEKIVVIPHGFSVENSMDVLSVFKNSEVLKYFKIDLDTKYILFVGRLEMKKNLINLVEAFEKFLKKYPDYILILAGKRGVGFNKIWKKITGLDLADKIIMPGYITEEEKAAFYSGCKVFVFPSLYEGFGLPILEAFNYRKPVLCSNVSSMPEVGGDAVCYINPHNVQEIAEGLDKLISDENYSKNLVEKGIRQLKKFSWERAAIKTLEVLQNALK